MMKKNISWLKEDLIAHRGLYNNIDVPENSKKAFIKAIESNYSIELDVLMLKDHHIVCFHDFNLERLTKLNKNINQVTIDEIKDLKLLNSLESICTLSDAIKEIDSKVNLLIEVKPFGDIKTTIKEVMKVLKDYKGNYAVFSFHPYVPYYLKKNHENVIRGQISEYFLDRTDLSKLNKFLLKTMFFNKFTKPDFISYSINNLPNKYLDRLKKKGITIISYAAKNQMEFDYVKSYYDNVVFENFLPKK